VTQKSFVARPASRPFLSWIGGSLAIAQNHAPIGAANPRYLNEWQPEDIAQLPFDIDEISFGH